MNRQNQSCREAVVRFIATADWQLGMSAHFLDADARPRYQQARFDAVTRIGELANECEAAFVLVCGDVFESNQLSRSVVAKAFESLRSFQVPVVLLPGNHDPLDAATIYDSAAFTERQPEHVHVLRSTKPFLVTPGVEIVGAPWFSKHPLGDLVAQATQSLDPVPATLVRIIAGHGALSSLNPDRDSLATIDERALQDLLDRRCAHFAVLGDRHSTHKAAERIWYPGTPEVTSRREEDPGNVLVVDVTGDQTNVEPVKIGQWTFSAIGQDIHSDTDIQFLDGLLQAMPDKERTAVWLALTGTLSAASRARLDLLIDQARDLFAHLDYWSRRTDLVTLPDQHDFADLGLTGFAADALTELVALAHSEDEDSPTAQDALSLLYRLVGGNR